MFGTKQVGNVWTNHVLFTFGHLEGLQVRIHYVQHDMINFIITIVLLRCSLMYHGTSERSNRHRPFMHEKMAWHGCIPHELFATSSDAPCY